MAKYIVDIPDEILEFMNGKFNFFIEPEVKVGECKHYKVRLDDTEITPYSEPDVVKNNKVNLCDSCNYIYPECPSERYDVMFGDGAGKDNICCCAGYRAINEQEIRQKVEDEVWEFVRRIIGMSEDKYCECFDIDDIADDDFASKYSYQEAKKVYEEWEKEKKEIRVGDEVIPLDTQYNTMVVTKLWTSEFRDEWVDTIADDGKTYNFLKTSIKKTGRHFDAVEKLLEEMRDESERWNQQ